jgi:hypothetical protein
LAIRFLIGVFVQKIIRRNAQPVFHSKDVIGCKNQIKVGTTFGKALNSFVTAEFESVSLERFKSCLLGIAVHGLCLFCWGIKPYLQGGVSRNDLAT